MPNVLGTVIGSKQNIFDPHPLEYTFFFSKNAPLKCNCISKYFMQQRENVE